MDLLKTILLYMSMLYISAVQVAPDPSTINVTPSPMPTQIGIYETAVVTAPTPTPIATPSITANPAYKTLVLGDRNESVKKVQQKLAELGYYTGVIDSAYGNQTRRAVEQFQYRNGLTVDGIAGKYTQTVLFESADAKSSPTSTPAFLPDKAITPPPVTVEPVKTITPEPVYTPVPQPTAAPEPTAIPEANMPVLLDRYGFVLAGFSEPLTVQDTDIVLHPAELEEALFVPLTEILQNAGNIIVTNINGNVEEIAFAVLTDYYQISYTVNDDGTLSNLVFEKNAQPQPLANRSAILLDDVIYLPLEDMARITGISFAMDDAAGIITVTMPAAGI